MCKLIMRKNNVCVIIEFFFEKSFAYSKYILTFVMKLNLKPKPTGYKRTI